MDKLVCDAIETGPVMVVADAKGRYVYVNKAWEELTGMRLEDVRGKYVKDVVADTMIEEVIERKERLVTKIFPFYKAETPWGGVYSPIIKDGEFRGVLINTFFVDSENFSAFYNEIESLRHKVQFYKSQLQQNRKSSLDAFIGKSADVQHIKQLVEHSARSPSPVLIEGETGTGKEIIAHAIHEYSARRSKPFIKLNCSAIPNELFESEMFGYEGGSFTGARKGGMKGKFELANGGSIFLDEINHLPMQHQPKLLRVLQEKEIMRIGGKESISLDTRLIVASNVPLHTLLQQHLFRDDLYYRLNVVRICIPPLRKRREDIPLIAAHIIESLNHSLGSDITGISNSALDLLCQYDWPGNVRELHNVLESAANWVWAGQLCEQHILNNAPVGSFFDSLRTSSGVGGNDEPNQGKERLLAALESCRWNKTLAAEHLDISRTTLYKRMRKYGIQGDKIS